MDSDNAYIAVARGPHAGKRSTINMENIVTVPTCRIGNIVIVPTSLATSILVLQYELIIRIYTYSKKIAHLKRGFVRTHQQTPLATGLLFTLTFRKRAIVVYQIHKDLCPSNFLALVSNPPTSTLKS